MPPSCAGMHHGPMMDGDPMPHVLHHLRLSEQQQDKLFTIMHEQAPALRQQRKTLDKARGELHKLAESGQYSDASAKSLTETIGRASAELALLHARSEQQVYALLTPDQRKQAEQMRMHGPEGDLPPHP